MTRRSKQAALATPASSTPARADSVLPAPTDPFHAEYAALRRHWKWAAFSQFFYTFAPLIAMPDIALSEVEDDLARSTAIVLPRIMHRLLITLTLDRKLALENWQTSLRKQYAKRDPAANPIGPEPVIHLPTPSPEPSDERPAEEESKSNEGPSAGPSSDAPAPPQNDASGSVAPDATMESQHPPSSEDQAGASPEQGPAVNSNPDVTMADADADERASVKDELPVQESKDWFSLPMLTKLDSLHLLTEWQFQNTQRIRQLMKSDDDNASWRIEPIGYDAKANAYWLIGPDRLWIQRMPPKPPRSLKRKRPPPKAKAKRAATPSDFADNDPEPEPDSKKRKANTHVQESPTSGRGSRAAKTQANKKLDAQAKELAKLQRQAALEGRRSGGRRGGLVVEDDGQVYSSRSSPRKAAPSTFGTRVSARLRGTIQEPQWQDIPDEWLRGEGSGSAETKRMKTGLEVDDDAVSDLTDLSDSPSASEPEPEQKPKPSAKTRSKNGKAKGKAKATAPPPEEEEEEKPDIEVEPEWRPPDDFVEWETLCITLYEWEHIAEGFANATHYREKALYKLLANHIVPEIVNELREIEHKKRVEEAVNHRKRSSRLAMKETEKEEARAAEIRHQEEQEKMSRTRRLEARLKREEEEREKRESAREKRRRDREEREEQARQQAKEVEESTAASTPIDVVAEDPQPSTKAKPAPRKRTSGARQKGGKKASDSDNRAPSGEDWELDCEVCFRRGINKDDGSPLLCCGKCNRWQHIACHDYEDRKVGRPKRDWNTEEFLCKKCTFSSSSSSSFQAPPPMSTTSGAYLNPGLVSSRYGSGAVPYGANTGPSYGNNIYGGVAYNGAPGSQFSHLQSQPSGFSPRAPAMTTGPGIPGSQVPTTRGPGYPGFAYDGKISAGRVGANGIPEYQPKPYSLNGLSNGHGHTQTYGAGSSSASPIWQGTNGYGGQYAGYAGTDRTIASGAPPSVPYGLAGTSGMAGGYSYPPPSATAQGLIPQQRREG
ncbi:hypothetical protein OF83DRAFT_668150 [Amylostereum chailletii]|nr:hypothetical protein OF83DRAFT_668150 [Amylostereum chailletii]